MKKIILIPILLFSLSLFSQEKVDENAENAKYFNQILKDNATIKAKNKELEAELKRFKDEQ